MDNPTIDVREGEQLDLAAVDACLRQHIGGLDGEPKLRQYASGNSSLTYMLEYYASNTGANIDNFDFYMVYGYFRNAVILRQIYYRYFQGQTRDQRFAFFGAAVAILSDCCRRLIAKSSL